MGSSDQHLGMHASITRRDFIGGVAAATAFASSPALSGPIAASAAQPAAMDYPPLRSGLRGQYPGSFEIAHQVRDGAFGAALSAGNTGEHHDLVVVGAGISGLAAAYFFRKVLGPERRVLLLDNHDDFGGHAKRNEFRHGGRTHLSFGGTMSIETPFPYSYTAKALLSELGVDASAFARYERPERVKGLGAAGGGVHHWRLQRMTAIARGWVVGVDHDLLEECVDRLAQCLCRGDRGRGIPGVPGSRDGGVRHVEGRGEGVLIGVAAGGEPREAVIRPRDDAAAAVRPGASGDRRRVVASSRSCRSPRGW